MACGICRFLRAKISKPDLCEQSNCQNEPQVISEAPPFLEERSLIQANLEPLSHNSRCSFWYYLGACRQHESRAGSIWSWKWIFCSGYYVSALWSRHLSTESTCDVVMYPRKTTTHHQSWGDANHLIRQYAKRAAWSAHASFVSQAIWLSTYVVPNANETIWSQRSHVNVVRLLPD
jgi:hypothetical protein